MVGSARRSERAAALVAILAVVAAVGLGLSGPAFGQPVRPSSSTGASEAAPPGASVDAAAPSSDPSSDPSTDPAASTSSTDPSSSTDPPTSVEPSSSTTPPSDPSTSAEPSTEPPTEPSTSPRPRRRPAHDRAADGALQQRRHLHHDRDHSARPGGKPVKINPPAPVLAPAAAIAAPDGSGTPPNLGLAGPAPARPGVRDRPAGRCRPRAGLGRGLGRPRRRRRAGAAAGTVTVWPAGADRPAHDNGGLRRRHARQRQGDRAPGERRRGGHGCRRRSDRPDPRRGRLHPGHQPTVGPLRVGPIHGAGFMTVVAELPSGRPRGRR